MEEFIFLNVGEADAQIQIALYPSFFGKLHVELVAENKQKVHLFLPCSWNYSHLFDTPKKASHLYNHQQGTYTEY